jgi:hypothetical protein
VEICGRPSDGLARSLTEQDVHKHATAAAPPNARVDGSFGDRPIAGDHAHSRRRLASEFLALHHSDRDGGRVLSLDQLVRQ